MNANATKAKLAPLTITITDQAVLKRIHRVARHYGKKPSRMAQTVLNGGLWKWVESIK